MTFIFIIIVYDIKDNTEICILLLYYRNGVLVPHVVQFIQ